MRGACGGLAVSQRAGADGAGNTAMMVAVIRNGRRLKG